MNFKKMKPQINAPSRASGGRIHVCQRAYVSMHHGGHNADERRFIKNEDAVSIALGFILMFSITVLVFSAIVLSFDTLSQQSKKSAMQGSFEIMGSGLAVRITTMDTLVNISNSYGGRVNTLEYDFSIPASIANEGYSVNITNNQVIIESDNGAKAWVPFNTSTNITQATIYSSAQDYKFIYNGTANAIEIGRQ